jgi:hypothetical protein
MKITKSYSPSSLADWRKTGDLCAETPDSDRGSIGRETDVDALEGKTSLSGVPCWSARSRSAMDVAQRISLSDS